MRKWIIILLDFVLLSIAVCLSFSLFLIYRRVFWGDVDVILLNYSKTLTVLTLVFPIWLPLLRNCGLQKLSLYTEYTFQRAATVIIERLAPIQLWGCAIFGLALFILRPEHASRFLVLLFTVVSFLIIFVSRLILFSIIRKRNLPPQAEASRHAPYRYSVDMTFRLRFNFLIDMLSIFVAYAIALLLRYESLDETIQLFRANWLFVLIIFIIQNSANFVFGLYSRLWRYASMEEGVQIAKAGIASTVLIYLADRMVLGPEGLSAIQSVSVIVLYGFSCIVMMGVWRLILRSLSLWLTNRSKTAVADDNTKSRSIIYGAGDMGEIAARLIRQNPELNLCAIGFIDDDRHKQGMYLQGLPVLGTRGDLNTLVKERKIDEVIIAMAFVDNNVIDEICQLCASVSVRCRVLPSLHTLITGDVSIDELRQWRRGKNQVIPIRVNSPNPERSKAECLLVTGGAGFIGSNFVRYMLKTYETTKIVVFDKLTYAGNPDNLLELNKLYNGRFAFVQGDICDYERVEDAIKGHHVTAVVNFAAETHVDRSLSKPEMFVDANVKGTFTLLEACRHHGVARFHQVSTDEVYGQVPRGSFAEGDPIETRSPYSATKASADLLVYSYWISFGLPVTITRGSNNIGPYQYPEKVVPLFITNALDNLPLPVYGDGGYVRDYQYVEDHCRGIDVVLRKGDYGEIYNLGGGNELRALDLAGIIIEKLGKPLSLVQLVADRQGQDRRYSLICDKINALGWKPQWTFDEAISSTIEWYVKNEWWWRKIKSGQYARFYEAQYTRRLEGAIRNVLG